MKIKIRSFNSTCFFSEFLLADIICVGNLFGRNRLISVAFMTTFIVLICYMAHIYKDGKIRADYLLLVVLCSINVAFNAMLSPIAHMNFDYPKKLIMFISAISFFVVVENIEIRKFEQKTSFWFGFFVALIFPVAYYVLNIRTMFGRFLTMGFTNPNFTALWILHGFLFAVIAFFYAKEIWTKAFICVVALCLIYLATLTVNRSIWVAIAFFFLFLIFGIKKSNIGLTPMIITFVILIPIIIVLIYHSLLSNSVFQRMFSFMVSAGKGLASRALLWDYAMDVVKSNWLFGDYSGISNGTGISQMHNTHLDVLCSYGIVPFVMFILILRRITIGVSREVFTFEQHVALCAFLSVLLFGIFEASLFSGCSGLNYLTGAFLVLARYRKQEE